MKKFKRIMALVLSLILVLGMSVPAMAEGTETPVNSITLRDKYDGHHYQAYQIFSGIETDGILSDIKWGNGFQSEKANTFLAALNNASVTKDGVTTKIFGGVFESIDPSGKTNDEIAAAIASAIAGQAFGHDAQFMQDFADVLHTKSGSDYVYLTGVFYTSAQAFVEGSSTEHVKDSNGNYVYVIDSAGHGIPDGYYLIKDEDETLDGKYDYYTRLLLQVVGVVDTQPKGSLPTVKKQVSSRLEDGYGQTADTQITDTVYFMLEGSLPANLDKYETYEYTFHDTLSAGINLSTENVDRDTNNDSFDDIDLPGIVDAYILHKDGTKTQLTIGNNENYTLKVDTEDKSTFPPENRGHIYMGYTHYYKEKENGEDVLKHTNDGELRELTIKFYDLRTSLPILLTDDKIVIKYAVTLNERAIIGEGTEVENNAEISNNEVGAGDIANENKVYLEFSNNPQGDGTGNTPEDDAEIFTFQMNINKVGENSSGGILPDAYFLLSNRLNQGTTILEADAREELDLIYDYAYPILEQDSETKAYMITDWFISGDAIVAMQEVEEDGVTKYYGLRTDGSYAWLKNGNPDVKIELSKNFVKSEKDKSIQIIGVNEGTYRLRELKAPAGYNILKEAIVVQINVEHNNNTGKITSFTVTAQGQNGTTNAKNGTATFELLNTKGSTLPSTGGIGTTIFYVVGSLMVLAAVVLLITRKRMSNEN